MISKWVRQACEALEKDPYSWELGRYHAIYKGPFECRIWSASGFWFYRLQEPISIDASFIEKIFLSLAFRKAYKNISLLEVTARRKQNGDKA